MINNLLDPSIISNSEVLFAKVLYWLFIAVLLVYNIFAFLLVRQVSLMNRSLKTEAAGTFDFVAKGHLLFSLAITALAIILA